MLVGCVVYLRDDVRDREMRWLAYMVKAIAYLLVAEYLGREKYLEKLFLK